MVLDKGLVFASGKWERMVQGRANGNLWGSGNVPLIDLTMIA